MGAGLYTISSCYGAPRDSTRMTRNLTELCCAADARPILISLNAVWVQ